MSLEEAIKKIQILESENQNLRLENQNLKRIIFGSKSEKLPRTEEQTEEQCSLFDDPKEIEKDVEDQIDKKIEEITVHKKKKSKTKKAGIKRSALKDVKIERNEYVIEENAVCPECKGNLKNVGKKVVRQEIEYEPPKLKITEYIKYVYKCEKCGTNGSKKESSTFVEAKVPKPILTHSFASPSLATEVMYQKYYLGVPLYRQEKMWEDRGLVLPRNMMANWVIKISEYYLSHIYELMKKQIKEENELLHCDETTMQCNKEAGRKATSNSYMWVLCSGEEEKKRGTIFQYNKSRSAETAQAFLKGYKGILVTDGYASYNNIEEIRHAECWAHARRYFYESIPIDSNKKMDTSCDGYIGVEYIDKLFEIEKKIANLSVEEKKEARNKKSKPILEEFYKWVTSTLEEKVIVNDKLKKALIYVQNQKKELSEFIKDGKIPLTNSLAERAIRPFAVHRKNWLFADSVEGAKANGVMYSIMETAKMNKLNIWKYIEYLLKELPQIENINNEKELEKYLPWCKELPEEILNYQGTYEELKIE